MQSRDSYQCKELRCAFWQRRHVKCHRTFEEEYGLIPQMAELNTLRIAKHLNNQRDVSLVSFLFSGFRAKFSSRKN